MFNRKLKQRIKELEVINEQHRALNGELREEIGNLNKGIEYWKSEAEIWKDLYNQELRGIK